MLGKNLQKYVRLIRKYTSENYQLMFREPVGILTHPFIVPGSCYSDCLWDWDSWITNWALRKIAKPEEIEPYERGCILNFIENMTDEGRMSITIDSNGKNKLFEDMKNIHKPCIAQHALFVSENQGDYEWIRDYYARLELFIDYYRRNCKHETGLYFWLDDGAIGVDNDPCTFYRPDGSSASIYLNCLMYKELMAMSALADGLSMPKKAEAYKKEAEALADATRENCYDERDGFYYSVDINLLPVDLSLELHSGAPRHWSCLIQRIGVWSGFMAMWAGIATPEQAERMVKEHCKNKATFCAPYGVRTLSKLEKMYGIIKSGNPSCWLGPIWGIANYMTFEGLVRYGYLKEAKALAVKSIKLYGRDLEKNGVFHEYYDPETGIGVNNPGFQCWNMLVVNMIEWLEKTDI